MSHTMDNVKQKRYRH